MYPSGGPSHSGVAYPFLGGKTGLRRHLARGRKQALGMQAWRTPERQKPEPQLVAG